MKFQYWLFIALAFCGLLSGCVGLENSDLPTPIPTEYMPTVVALTLQAQGVPVFTPAPANQPSGAPGAAMSAAVVEEISETPRPSAPNLVTETPAPPASPMTQTVSDASSNEPTHTGAPATTTLAPPTVGATPTIHLTLPTPDPSLLTPSPAPPIPDAPLQIYRLGEMSRVISPIQVTTRLTSGNGKVLRIELFGEDGRLLARYLRTFQNIPWQAARVDVNLDFEISGAGELGRLVVSLEDVYGRLIDVNSVNLILLSSGQTELNPATALQQRLVIQEPTPKALIQGGKLIVSGRALPNRPDQPLRVMIISEEGRILGQRLARVNVTIPGDYGVFIAEVPYTVTDLTSALLVVFEEGEPISDIAYLSSIEVMLAP